MAGCLRCEQGSLSQLGRLLAERMGVKKDRYGEVQIQYSGRELKTYLSGPWPYRERVGNQSAEAFGSALLPGRAKQPRFSPATYQMSLFKTRIPSWPRVSPPCHIPPRSPQREMPITGKTLPAWRQVSGAPGILGVQSPESPCWHLLSSGSLQTGIFKTVASTGCLKMVVLVGSSLLPPSFMSILSLICPKSPKSVITGLHLKLKHESVNSGLVTKLLFNFLTTVKTLTLLLTSRGGFCMSGLLT